MSSHEQSPGNELVRVHAPGGLQDPGLPPHQPRLGDGDPAAAKRSERIVATLFGVSVVGSVGAIVAYFTVVPGETVRSIQMSNMLLGLGMFLAVIGIGLAAIHWAKSLMSDHEVVEERHAQRSSDATRDGAVAELRQGAQDSGIARRSALKGAVITALALLPLPILVPLVGNIGGEWAVGKLKHTMWRRGVRLATDPGGRPIRAADVTIGSVVHVIPENLARHEEIPEDSTLLNEKAKAVVLLIRLDERDMKFTEGTFHGIVAYSKICTHVGCPVALYEQQTHHLLCPCHQSTFDVADRAKVVFGPAKRPLPQLPITVDDEGYLVATDDFPVPIGPSFWEMFR